MRGGLVVLLSPYRLGRCAFSAAVARRVLEVWLLGYVGRVVNGKCYAGLYIIGLPYLDVSFVLYFNTYSYPPILPLVQIAFEQLLGFYYYQLGQRPLERIRRRVLLVCLCCAVYLASRHYAFTVPVILHRRYVLFYRMLWECHCEWRGFD